MMSTSMVSMPTTEAHFDDVDLGGEDAGEANFDDIDLDAGHAAEVQDVGAERGVVSAREGEGWIRVCVLTSAQPVLHRQEAEGRGG